MKRFLCACLFLILVCNAQAQRFVRPFNTIADMVATANPADPNTNVVTIAPFQFWTWYKGNLDVPNGNDTFASTWPSAAAGNWKLQGGLFSGGSGGQTNIIFGNTNVIVITVQTIAQLKALNPCAGIGTVFVQGYYAPGDGGGRQVVWKPNDATPDDGFLVFRPNNELQCSGTWTSVFPQGTYTGFNLNLAGGVATNFSYNAVRDYTVSVGGAPLVWPRVASIVDTTANSLALVSNESMSGEDGNQIVGNSTNALFFGHDGTNVSIKGLGISGGITGIILSNWNGGMIEGNAFSSVTNGIVLINCTGVKTRNNTFGVSVANPIVTLTSTGIKEDEDSLALPEIGSGSPVIAGSGRYYSKTSDHHPHFLSSTGTDYDLSTAIPPGSDTQIPFNDGGVLGASTNLVFTKSNSKLILGNHASTSSTLAMFVSSGGASTFNSGGGDMALITGSGSILLSGNSMQFPESSHTIGSGTTPLGTLFALKIMWDNASNVFDAEGTGTPEGVVSGGIGSTFRRHDGGAGTCFYVKETGIGNTGWVAK